VAKLRRLANALGNDDKFDVQIAGKRNYLPVKAVYNIEHDRGGLEEEVEFQIKWFNQ
jgi:hypothetical protein